MRPATDSVEAGLLIVVGLNREAAIVAGRGHVLVGTTGLAAALARPWAGVVSFGLCGGLDPALGVGDLIVAGGVVSGAARFAADPAWARALRAALPGARGGEMAAGDVILGDVAAKAALRRASGAVAVDMESHAVARAATAAGLPFAVVRAVSDGAGRALPRSAQAGFKTGFKADGDPDIAAVIAALARRPWELPALIGVAIDSARAFKALETAALGLAPPYGSTSLGA